MGLALRNRIFTSLPNDKNGSRGLGDIATLYLSLSTYLQISVRQSAHLIIKDIVNSSQWRIFNFSLQIHSLGSVATEPEHDWLFN